jgi:uncharacterized SAM-binding protein YcdF (DUF218 family)
LSGGLVTRIPKALELYEKGAEKISQALNIQVEFEVVPSLKGGATSTFDEAYDLLAFCSKEKLKHLIIVTDSFHTRRALYAFKKVFQGSGVNVEASAAPNEIYSEENWWHSDKGISAYLLESVKFAVYLLSSKNVSYIQND